MVAGHIGFGKFFDHYIHAYHMPLFFFVSGYLYRKPRSIKSLVKKRAKTLLTPYIAFGLIYWISDCVFIKCRLNVESLVRLFTFNSNGLAISGAIWFFTAAFFANILYCSIHEKIKSKYGVAGVVLLISLFGNIFPELSGFRLPWSLDAACVGVGFIYAGNMLKQKIGDKHLIKNDLILGLLLLINIAMIFVNGDVNMKQAQYANIILFWVNAILAIILIFEISKKLDCCRSVLVKCVLQELKYIGKNTVVYLCLNQLFILWMNNLWDFMKIQSLLIEGVYKIIMLVVTLLVLHLTTEIINGTKLRLLIGK